jgi:hypothetical protein
MQLDVRLPMGWLFLCLGLILLGYGLIPNQAMYDAHSLGENVNLLWGSIFALFGGVTLFIARSKKG